MDERVVEFTREAEAVGAAVHVCARTKLGGTLSRLVAASPSVIAGASLERYADELRKAGIEVMLESAMPDSLANASGVAVGVCEALAGVAASGTVLVGPGSGLEGIVTTLPPHSIIVLEGDHIHADIAGALKACADLVAAPGARLAFITGPSRTSDIELTPVVGVHGPLRLDLVVLDG